MKIFGHEWVQIKIVDENGNDNWYNYDLTNDPDRIKDNSLDILENDETFYKRFNPHKREKPEKCPKSIQNKIIYEANLNRTLKTKTFNQLVEGDQIIFEGQYSGKRLGMQDISNILSSLTLSEIKYITDLIKQVLKQGKLEIEASLE